MTVAIVLALLLAQQTLEPAPATHGLSGAVAQTAPQVQAQPGSPDDIARRADAAYARQEYGIAAPLYRQLADSGRADAMTRLGSMYEKGQSLAQSDAQSVAWYRRAAEKGDPVGMTNLGRMYEEGRGVAQDYAEALSWYRKSADMGDPSGTFHLGVMYATGRGVPRDFAQAVVWYRKAAEMGDPSGMTVLGLLCAQGRGGVAQDDAQAVLWFRRAAEKSDASGMNHLAGMYRAGRGVTQDDVQAVAWYRKSAEMGDAMGMNNLGRMYEAGRGLAQDNAQAMVWYRKAAELGDTSARAHLIRIARELGVDPGVTGPATAGSLPPGVYRIGGGASAPIVIHHVEPEYSEQARNAKFQGIVVLSTIVDETGHPTHVKIVRPLGLGLDEKAIEAVQQWRFRPGLKDGKPVPVLVTVEVNFRL